MPARRSSGPMGGELQLNLDELGTPEWVRRALIGLTLALIVFGLLAVYSATSFQAEQSGLSGTTTLMDQIARALAGGAAMMTAAYVDYRVWQRLAWPLMAVVGVLLVILVSPGTESFAPAVNGSRRWIALGPATFQPSELAKTAVVFWTAALAVKKGEQIKDFRDGLLPFLVILLPVLFLINQEPHLSATLITAGVAAAVLFSAGVRIRHGLALVAVAVPVAVMLVRQKGYQVERVMAFLDPTGTASDAAHQLRQAQIAIGAGGPFGAGYGQSTQKLYFLPEASNDFIFPIIAEEWGFAGAAGIVVLFLVWTMLGLRIARSAPDRFGRLVGVGMTAIVFIGAFGHMGITMGLMPTTGVSLPFVSAGGTGLVTAMGATGVLLSISSRRRWA